MGTIAQLTKKQRDVLRLAAEGKANSEIATILHLAPSTIPAMFDDIYRKLGVRQARQQAIHVYLKGYSHAA